MTGNEPERQTSGKSQDAARTPSKVSDETQAFVRSSQDIPADLLAPAQMPDEMGRLGSYRILKTLGAGGMGIVFAAEDVQLKRPVALKIMLPAFSADKTQRQRFLREAQAAAAIRHDHIVTIYQVGEDRNVPFLAMELLQGEMLQTCLDREGALPVDDVLRIGREIADGLAAAHEVGLIHRDIKPSNIFLEEVRGRGTGVGKGQHAPIPGLRSPTSVRVKLLDFGLARREDTEVQLTQTGMSLGTPHYMAPEQASGEKVDHRADLFSLGCVLYRMVTGRLPFPGDNLRSIFKAVMFEPHAPVSKTANVPPALATLIDRLLAKERTERPQSAAEVVEALASLPAENVPIPRGQTTAAYRRTELATGVRSAGDTAVSKSPGRSWTRVWIVLSVICVVGGLVATLLLNSMKQGSALLPETDAPLKHLVGTWSVEHESTQEPGKTMRGKVRFDWVSNDKFLRGYFTFEDGEIMTILRNDAEAKTFRRWSFSSQPFPFSFQGPSEGQWDAKTKTLTWRGPMPLFLKMFHEDHWIDENHVEARTEIKNHVGEVVLKQTMKMHRLNTNEAVAPKLAKNPKRPPEFNLLDGFVGSWASKSEVTLPELGNKKFQAEPTTQAGPILAGRFVEERVSNPGRQDYMLLGCDENRKTYRFWHFAADGDVVEADGSWDEAAKKLTWKSLDKRFEGTWTMTGDDERRAKITLRDAQGRLVSEVEGVSRRVSAAEPGWVQLFNAKDMTGFAVRTNWSVDKGVLVGKDKAYLASGAEYKNFHARLKAKYNAECVASLVLGESDTNVYVRIGNHIDQKTGALIYFVRPNATVVAPYRKELVPPDTWFDLDLVVRGNHVVVKVNGSTTADKTLDDMPKSGTLTLGLAAAGSQLHVEKFDIKELPITSPFVVVASGKRGEQGHATLGAAVAAATSGDTIEIRGNGPFVTPTIELGKKALTIRAGAGFWPVLSATKEVVAADGLQLRTGAALTLEGLEFRRDGTGKPNATSLSHIASSSAPLAVANCRFVLTSNESAGITAIRASGSTSFDVRNCMFLGDWHAGPNPQLDHGNNRTVVKNCLFLTRKHALALSFDPSVAAGSVEIVNNTMIVNSVVGPGVSGSIVVKKEPAIRLDIHKNICSLPLINLVYHSKDKDTDQLLERDHQTLARQLFVLDEKGNQFLPGGSFAVFFTLPSTGKRLVHAPIKSQAEHNEYWRLKTATSIVAPLRFAKDLSATMPVPEKLLPQDFRANDAVSKNVGADVDLAGPGPAYERWKQTKDYQQWLKAGGQVQ